MGAGVVHSAVIAVVQEVGYSGLFVRKSSNVQRTLFGNTMLQAKLRKENIRTHLKHDSLLGLFYIKVVHSSSDI